jgi:hypothetical protein
VLDLAANPFSSVIDRWQLLIDLGILVVLGSVHVKAWPKYPDPDAASYKEQAQTGIRSAATGGITVAGILIPLSILTISLAANGRVKLPSTVLTDFFVANFWLLISLVLGLYVLYVAGVKGYKRNILAYRATGIAYGLQLLFLAVGVFRLFFGMYGLVDKLM